jgi:hypothetical protein
LEGTLNQGLHACLVDLPIVSALIKHIVKIEVVLLDVLGQVNFVPKQ